MGVTIPCPHCTDGFTTSGDRHARTNQDVCKHCGGTHQAPAGTGERPETSYQPDTAGHEADLIRMLIADNARMRAAGLRLSEAALHVIREYDGVHRLSLAVAGWATAVANEGGRGKAITNATILLVSGNSFNLLAPETSTYTIEDIAHGLSMICRFTGQCSRFYSVAQHSVLASHHVAPEHAYAALMHDAAEAIIGDVSRPVKQLLPDYQALEQRIETAVFARFGVPYPLAPEVKDVDMLMLATEQHHLMPDRAGRSYAGGKTPLGLALRAMAPREAREAFLARYAELAGGSA